MQKVIAVQDIQKFVLKFAIQIKYCYTEIVNKKASLLCKVTMHNNRQTVVV